LATTWCLRHDVLQLLDEIPTTGTPTLDGDWFPRIERSLDQSPRDWISAVEAIGDLSDEHAWGLLSWIEVAASHVVRARSRATLVTAAFGMSLVLQSRLDRRDCSIVASLLHRGAQLSGLDFTSSVTEGCDRAGPMGQEARTLLLNAGAKTPSTHTESGESATFSFTRREPNFDVDDLERWLERDGQ
jgi:hypothetical protein